MVGGCNFGFMADLSELIGQNREPLCWRVAMGLLPMRSPTHRLSGVSGLSG